MFCVAVTLQLLGCALYDNWWPVRPCTTIEQTRTHKQTCDCAILCSSFDTARYIAQECVAPFDVSLAAFGARSLICQPANEANGAAVIEHSALCGVHPRVSPRRPRCGCLFCTLTTVCTLRDMHRCFSTYAFSSHQFLCSSSAPARSPAPATIAAAVDGKTSASSSLALSASASSLFRQCSCTPRRLNSAPTSSRYDATLVQRRGALRPMRRQITTGC